VVAIDPAVQGRVVMADGLRLSQVLNNLVNNAIKFSTHGQIRIALALVAEADGLLQMRFEVSDQGVGIAPQDQARVFQLFEQVDSSATRTQGGTGLGLAICSRLVAQMGGQIGVDSQPGTGSTFWFTIRLAATSADPARPPMPPSDHGEGLPPHLAGTWILVAEDNPINQEVAQALLEDLGLRVDVVADGQEAVDAAARKRYGLIFMDMQMPRLNGLDATRAIRADGPNRDTPIVAMTANAFEEDRRLCLAAGMSDFLTKPMSFDQLPTVLLTWLDRAGTGHR